MNSLKWMVFVLLLLVVTANHETAIGKAPKVVTLSESEVATVTTALGYTTMLQFDGRPTSAVLGDQDAFKVEYIGNGLAIKPTVPHSKTNLFVFTDYDRFNFKLVTGGAAEADYVLRVRRQGYGVQSSNSETGKYSGEAERLIRKTINRSATCGGMTLTVEAVAWPASQSSYLIQFRADLNSKLFQKKELEFEPGDLLVFQAGKNLPIESLHLNRLTFLRTAKSVSGTVVLRQSALSRNLPLQLVFLPDFHRSKYPRCPRVSFSRNSAVPQPAKKS